MAAGPQTPLELVRQVIGEYSDAPPEAVTLAASLDELQIDSLTLAEMLFSLEDHLGVTMPEDLERPATVGDLVRVVEPYWERLQAGS
jgi:acyl carrier protein